jgi:hypothetical protein
LILIVSLLTSYEALIFDCDYGVRTIWTQPNLYYCTAKVVVIGDSRNLTDVSQNHLPGKSNIDVKGFSLTGAKIGGRLPSNIANFFPNLESIHVTTSIDEISREDIEKFINLKELHLYNNKIVNINNNLLAGNPKVQAISFNENPVRHVALNVFDHLLDLKHMIIWGPCLQETTNRTAVKEIIFRVTVYCPPTSQMINEAMMNSIEFQRAIDEQVAVRVNPLQYQVYELEKRVSELEKRQRIELNSKGNEFLTN